MLESYFINKRADTLIEAINLYEQEMRHTEQINEIRYAKQMSVKAYNQATNATILGALNLFKR